MLLRKGDSIKERATAALSSLQRNAYAMGMLRSKIESRMTGKRTSADNSELARVLELVRSGELLLNEMSEKIESARFLEEFIHIINGAADSVSEIRGDMQELAPTAEAALAQMQDAISQVSMFINLTKDEMDPLILTQLEEMGKANASSQVAMVKETKEIADKQAENTPEEMRTEVAV